MESSHHVFFNAVLTLAKEPRLWHCYHQKGRITSNEPHCFLGKKYNQDWICCQSHNLVLCSNIRIPFTKSSLQYLTTNFLYYFNHHSFHWHRPPWVTIFFHYFTCNSLQPGFSTLKQEGFTDGNKATSPHKWMTKYVVCPSFMKWHTAAS